MAIYYTRLGGEFFFDEYMNLSAEQIVRVMCRLKRQWLFELCTHRFWLAFAMTTTADAARSCLPSEQSSPSWVWASFFSNPNPESSIRVTRAARGSCRPQRAGQPHAAVPRMAPLAHQGMKETTWSSLRRPLLMVLLLHHAGGQRLSPDQTLSWVVVWMRWPGPIPEMCWIRTAKRTMQRALCLVVMSHHLFHHDSVCVVYIARRCNGAVPPCFRCGAAYSGSMILRAGWRTEFSIVGIQSRQLDCKCNR